MLNIFNKSKGKAGLVGIYFTQKGVSLAHVNYTKNEPKLLMCNEFAAESLADKEKALAQQVEKLGLQESRASYILSPSEYKLFLVEAPSVSSGEMESAVKWKIKDLIEGAVDEMAITVFPVPDDAYRGETDMIYAVASRKTRIREIVDLVHNAGLQLDAIDIPEMVMKNLSTLCTFLRLLLQMI
ncbi:MAG: hypothetical protein P8M72_11805 [Gammaproteobacteria bacterium]|nr:hypothetical protein [Gammaproteobacteria bacterium]